VDIEENLELQTAAQESQSRMASKRRVPQVAKSAKNSRVTHKGLLQTTLKGPTATHHQEGMKQFLQQTLNLPLNLGS